jgi:AraC-like DNA-binding protein
MPVHKDRYRRPRQSEVAARVRPVFDDFHLLRMEGNAVYPLHQHTNYEAILVERGPYRCRLNDGRIELGDGQALVIKPGDWHSDDLRDGQRHHVLHFRLVGTGASGAAPLLRADVEPGEQVCVGDYSNEATLLRELRAESEAGRPYAGAVQDGLLSALFWRLVRGLSAQALSPEFRRIPSEESERERIAAVFARSVGSATDVPALARACGVSQRQLTARCRHLFGESPARLLLRLRLERAEELLRYRGMRVREVSEALGFANPYHFSTVFRRHAGRPPGRVRNAG